MAYLQIRKLLPCNIFHFVPLLNMSNAHFDRGVLPLFILTGAFCPTLLILTWGILPLPHIERLVPDPPAVLSTASALQLPEILGTIRRYGAVRERHTRPGD